MSDVHARDHELRCVGLQKSYGALKVTNDFDIHLRRGEVHALIGPNGAGKTTALAQLSGELRPDAGQVLLGDFDISALTLPQRVHAGIARSYQISSVFKSFTARESVELALQAVHGHSFRFFRPASSNKTRIARALELLETVGLAHAENVSAAELSHGQTRQLEIAMALASGPGALLLDEPMAGMAAEEAEALAALITTLKTDAGVLLVEHDMDIVFAVATRITVLSEGSVIATGPPAEIRANSEVQRLYLRDDVEEAG